VESPDLKDHRELTVWPPLAQPDLLDLLEAKEEREFVAPEDQQELRDSLDLKEPQDLRVVLDHKDLKVPLEQQAFREPSVFLDPPDLKDLLVPKGLLEQMDQQGHLVLQDRVDPKEIRVAAEMLERHPIMY